MDSIESKALHAIIDHDVDEAKRLVSTLLTGEAGNLSRSAKILSDIADDRALGIIRATGDAKIIEDQRTS